MKLQSYRSMPDLSLWLLIATNILTIYFAVQENWNIWLLLLIYCFQSAAIGFFNILRILRLKSFGKTGLILNGKFLTDATPEARWTLAIFFLIHFGIFLGIPFTFVLAALDDRHLSENLSSEDMRFFATAVLAFIVCQAFAYFYNRPNETTTQNVGSLMMYPYLRIIPMFMVLGAGTAFPGSLLIYFLSLKTGIDGVMHIIEQRHLFETPEPEKQ